MKIYPSFEDFKESALKFPLVPVYTDMLGDLETPVSAFLKIQKGSYNFLLESAEQEEKTGRFSFLGTSPELIIKGKDREVEVFNNLTGEKKIFESDNTAGILDRIIEENRSPLYSSLPGFTGGLIGGFSYDFVRQVEKLPALTADEDRDFPEFFFMFARNIIIFDHFKRKIILVSNVRHSDFDSLEQAYENGKENLLEMKEKLCRPVFFVKNKTASEKEEFKSNFEKKDFEEAVRQVKRYIKNGDIIQSVISQRWERKLDMPPFNIYRALRSVNPSPYMFYIEAENLKLVGSSPEILVKLDRGRATLRPIAGTRPRGRDEHEEKEMEKELAADIKEKAEHIMLVDLGRNDLGRICKTGSVTVTSLMEIEKYSHVMHLVSNVEGEMEKDRKLTDLIKASFPAGTVSGAPKIRAMEIIEEVEPSRRGMYAGAVGYFSLHNNMDFCITIRTLIIKGDRVYIQAGAGIVADSVPEKEYRETENKAKGLMEAYKCASEIE